MVYDIPYVERSDTYYITMYDVGFIALAVEVGAEKRYP